MSVSVISRRPTEQSERVEQTRTALLDATRRLLAERGAFAGLSVAQIAVAAGVSRPTFYAYFRDKRDLVLALASEMQEDLRAVADPWLRGESGMLRETLEGVLAGFRRHGVVVAAIVEAATYDEDVAAFWRAFHQWFVTSGTQRALKADPTLSQEDATASAYALVWMTERALTEHMVAPQVGDAALIRAIERQWRAVIEADEPRT